MGVIDTDCGPSHIVLRYRYTIYVAEGAVMSTLCKTYADDDAARRAVDVLRAAGVPGHDIRLLTGDPLRDVRSEPVGSFAGTLAPDAPVGTFAGRVRLRCQGNGTFAGSADRQRKGC